MYSVPLVQGSESAHDQRGLKLSSTAVPEEIKYRINVLCSINQSDPLFAQTVEHVLDAFVPKYSASQTIIHWMSSLQPEHLNVERVRQVELTLQFALGNRLRELADECHKNAFVPTTLPGGPREPAKPENTLPLRSNSNPSLNPLAESYNSTSVMQWQYSHSLPSSIRPNDKVAALAHHLDLRTLPPKKSTSEPLTDRTNDNKPLRFAIAIKKPAVESKENTPPVQDATVQNVKLEGVTVENNSTPETQAHYDGVQLEEPSTIPSGICSVVENDLSRTCDERKDAWKTNLADETFMDELESDRIAKMMSERYGWSHQDHIERVIPDEEQDMNDRNVDTVNAQIYSLSPTLPWTERVIVGALFRVFASGSFKLYRNNVKSQGSLGTDFANYQYFVDYLGSCSEVPSALCLVRRRAGEGGNGWYAAIEPVGRGRCVLCGVKHEGKVCTRVVLVDLSEYESSSAGSTPPPRPSPSRHQERSLLD